MMEYKHFAVPNVWLRNGYEESESPYGKVVSYEDVEGLEHLLQLEVLLQDYCLTGKQIRFLRRGLALTQPQLAERLQVDPQTIARWEKEETPVTLIIDQAMRLECLRKWRPRAEVSSIVSPKTHARAPKISLEFINGAWKRVATTAEVARSAAILESSVAIIDSDLFQHAEWIETHIDVETVIRRGVKKTFRVTPPAIGVHKRRVLYGRARLLSAEKAPKQPKELVENCLIEEVISG